VIQDGEGGIRFTSGTTQYPNSWGNMSWSKGSDYELDYCGPDRSSLCHNKVYTVPLGSTFIFDWALYDDQYAFEMQCGTGQSWLSSSYLYGSATEVRSGARCEITSVTGNTTVTFKEVTP
jgi:hypothetical protein